MKSKQPTSARGLPTSVGPWAVLFLARGRERMLQYMTVRPGVMLQLLTHVPFRMRTGERSQHGIRSCGEWHMDATSIRPNCIPSHPGSAVCLVCVAFLHDRNE